MSQENRTSLQKQIEEAETKIKQLEHQNTRLENRGRYLQKGERAKRTHRASVTKPIQLALHLCDMGGAIQSISPEADRLPKTQFYCLMERVFALPEVHRLVRQAQEES